MYVGRREAELVMSSTGEVELPLKAGPRFTRDGTPRGLKLGSRDVPKKLVLTRNLLAIRMLGPAD